MALSFFNNRAETTSSTGTGNIVLDDVAVSGSSVFDATMDGKIFRVGIKHSNLTDWEISDCLYTDSTKTLSSRTLVDSSTGSLLNLTGTGHVVAASIVPAEHVELAHKQSIGYISGVSYTRASTTSIEIQTGEIVINGVLEVISAAFTTKTAASSALTTSSLYHIYLTNESGTIKQEWDIWASTADDPVYDSDLDYWKHPSGGASFRYIGSFYTDGSSLIKDFIVSTSGRSVHCHCDTAFTIVNGISASTSASLAGVVSAAASYYDIALLISKTTSNGVARVQLRHSSSSGPPLLDSAFYLTTGDTAVFTSAQRRYIDTVYVNFHTGTYALSIYVRGFKVQR